MSEDKFTRARAASIAASDERDSARRAARVAIDKMLAALSLALDGGSMMGLPNLGRSSLPYRGVRAMSHNADEPLPRAEGGRDGREILCLSIKGELEFVACAADLSLRVRPATEDDYLAEWPQDIAEAILTAIEYHLQGSSAAIERYTRLRRLSYRLADALSEKDVVAK